jgi:hypothetical protein
MTPDDLTGSRYALIVANSAYEDARLRQLRAPSRDADELARVLGDAEIGGFEVEQSRNEPAHLLRRRIALFFGDRSTGDVLLLHLSGHGVKDEDGSLHFATSDTDAQHLDATAIPADFLNRQMARSRSKSIVLFLDCCFSGAFARGALARGTATVGVKENFDGQGKIVLTSSNSAEYSFEGTEVEGHGDPSYFTTAVVTGLETGAADRDGDQLVSVEELYDYVYEEVRSRTPNQTPCKWTFDVRGDIFVARNPAPVVVTTAILPDPLLEALDHPMPSVREGAAGDLARMLSSRDRRVAEAARLALTELLDDDSRRVAQTAQFALGTEAAPVAAAPEPASALPPAPVVTAPPPVAPVATEPAAPVVASVVTARAAKPRSASASEHSRVPVWMWALTVAAAVCLVVGLTLPLSNDTGYPDSTTLLAVPRYGLWFKSMFWYTIEVFAVPLATLTLLVLTQRGQLPRRVAASAVVGFGLQTTAGGLGVIWYARRPHMAISDAGIALLIGGLLILAAGILWRWRAPRADPAPPGRSARPTAAAYTCLAGAAVMLLGLFVPVDVYHRLASSTSHVGWLTLEIVVAILVTTAVATRALLGRDTDPLSERAMVLAVGFQSFWFFFGYAAAPTTNTHGLPWHPGDFLGLVGAAVVLYGAWRLSPSSVSGTFFPRRDRPEAPPLSTAP